MHSSTAKRISTGYGISTSNQHTLSRWQSPDSTSGRHPVLFLREWRNRHTILEHCEATLWCAGALAQMHSTPAEHGAALFVLSFNDSLAVHSLVRTRAANEWLPEITRIEELRAWCHSPRHARAPHGEWQLQVLLCSQNHPGRQWRVIK